MVPAVVPTVTVTFLTSPAKLSLHTLNVTRVQTNTLYVCPSSQAGGSTSLSLWCNATQEEN